ncbi:MAG TPA: protein-disulfide reductase DsbD [Spongiibacteraceae bacterium]|jgi:thiol:disulfide interchange protein DsbD|nr:protein-disulfide reductase DsbD [Spongiibacteraceae bacterium]HUH38239.1 protein-disulfide reductase DsbD [Spongiibacteraceae bacterium]
MPTRIFTHFTGLLLLALLFVGGAQANDPFAGRQAAEPEFLAVDQAYQLSFDRQASGALVVVWEIAEGYYLYRDRLELSVQDGATRRTLTPELPAGKLHEDEYFGRTQVYYHQLAVPLDDLPPEASGQLVVSYQGCADAGLCYPPRTRHFELRDGAMPLETDAPPARAATPPAAPPSAPGAGQPLWLMAVFAALGGLILNLMPCVFPVLSLKVLSFVRDDQHSHALHGVSYTFGVVLSFVAMAAILVALRGAGEAAGWGFQLQSPWFIAALIYLFFILGLNLSGAIELGGGLANLGAGLTQRPGYGGSFFTGALAVLVASPCTAPFMGTALGFAVTQPAPVTLTVFAALGLGMAAPILILCLVPGWLAWLPRPGRWLETFKQLLAYPLYATCIWLLWVLGRQSGVDALALVLAGCLGLLLAAWLWRRGSLLQRSLAATAAALVIALLANPLLRVEQAATAASWEPYSETRLNDLRGQGVPVFINATADWCLTCLANERLTLSDSEIRDGFQRAGIHYLKADWTRADPAITALLARHGRNGVPLYLYFAPDAAEPVILPQLLRKDHLRPLIEQAGIPAPAFTIN